MLQHFPSAQPHLTILRRRADRATFAALSCLNQALTYEAEWNRQAGLTQDPQILAALKEGNYRYLTNIGFSFERLTTARIFILFGESIAAVRGEVFSDPLNAIRSQHNFYGKWLVGKYEENWKLWNDAPVGYHTLDMQGNIMAINHTGTTMLGYERPGQLVGKSIFDFVLPEQREEARQRFEQKLDGNQVSPTQNRIYVRQSGSFIYVSARDRLHQDPQGRTIGVKTALIDITKQKEFEEMRRELERVSGLQKLAAGVADGINNPLMGISGVVQLMERWLSLPPESRNDQKARQYLDQIKMLSGDAKKLADMLLGYSGTKKPEFGSIYPRLITYYINSNFAKPDNIELIVKDAASWRIKGDDQLYQAVMNLVHNAKEAIGDNQGKIEISTRNVEYKDKTTTQSGPLPAGKYVMFSVRDDGPGISKKDQRKIFEPFYTTKGTRDSKGWGLAVTLGVTVRSCGGGINLLSEPGRGSTFTLLIPAFDPAENK